MFTAAVPVLLTRICWAPLLLPTITLPKFTLAGDADSCPTGAADPVPVKGTLRVGFVALLLVIFTLPVWLPTVVGTNATLNDAVPPGPTVIGVVMPLTVKFPPLSPICEMVSDAVPVFVTVKLCDFVCPSTTLPKLKLAGETDNPACVPVPLSAMLSDGFDALLVIVIEPVVLPDAVGVNVALSVTLEDGFTVTVVVTPDTV
jgi:hypothetical protein